MLLVMRMCSKNYLKIHLKYITTCIMRERNSDGIKDLPNYATF